MKKFEDIWKEANEEADLEYDPKGVLARSLILYSALKKRIDPFLEKQQAEIPEFVATEIERLKSEGIKTLCDFYNCDVDWMTFGMEDLRGDELAVAKWFYHNTETFELAYSYGYTVAKEKRFYLKHIDFCKRDKDYDWYMIKHSDGPLNHLRVEKGTLPPTVDTYFTQQEIDSMETGSYEQFEVEE